MGRSKNNRTYCKVFSPIFSLLILLLSLSIISAQIGINNDNLPKIYSTPSQAEVNYSLVNTNNSQYLGGFPASYFYPYSNPYNFTNSTSINFTNYVKKTGDTMTGDLIIQKNTGTASITPVTLNLSNTAGGSDWDRNTSYENIDFYTVDGSGPAGTTTRSRIGQVMEGTAGGSTALTFYTNDATLQERLRITSAGNLGIGTNNPLEKLQVNGNILQGDNQKSYFGDAKDSAIYYDGGNLRINPQEVGSGGTVFTGNVGIGKSPSYPIDAVGIIKGDYFYYGNTRNMLIAMQSTADYSMTGDYDRNEIQDAGVRGLVTVDLVDNTTAPTGAINYMFDSAEGNRYYFRTDNGSATITIDMLEAQPNYARAFWQPFVQFRTFTQYSHFKNITFECSSNGVAWFTTTEWQTNDSASGAKINGLWMPEDDAQCGTTAPRYFRFNLSAPYNTGSGSNPSTVYISEIGVRHILAPYQDKYVTTTGGKRLYGTYNYYANGTISPVKISLDSEGGNIVATGNLTIDTNTLYVDSNTNKIGLGTTTPNRRLTVMDDFVEVNSTGYTGYIATNRNALRSYLFGTYNDGTFLIRDATSAVDRLIIQNVSGNIGIGGTPTEKLYVAGNIITDWADRRIGVQYLNGADYQNGLSFDTVARSTRVDSFSADTSSNIIFRTGTVASPSEKLRILYNGNIEIPIDNQKLLFGTAKDSSIYYDGTDLHINPKEVGTGIIRTDGTVGFTTTGGYTRFIQSGSALGSYDLGIWNSPTANVYKLAGWDTGAGISIDTANGRLMVGAVPWTASLYNFAVAGNSIIGNGTGNLTIDNDGTLRLNGTATVFNDMLGGLTLGSGSQQQPTYDETLQTYTFHNDIIALQDYVYIAMQLPHGYKQGTDLGCHIHLMPSTTNTGNVTFSMNYTWTNMNEVQGAVTSIFGTKEMGGVANNQTIVAFPTITGTGKTISSIFKFKLTRESANATDTFTGDALVDYVDCHYEQDTLGSNTEYGK